MRRTPRPKQARRGRRAANVIFALLGVAGLLFTCGIESTAALSASSWGNAHEVPHTATLNVGGDAVVNSISCPSAGNCSAGGSYTVSPYHFQAFVVDESGGTWGQAHEVPHTATLNVGGDAEVISISCPSAGNCSAGGSYEDLSHRFQVFVVNEAHGAWGQAQEVPHTATLNAGGWAQVDSISCPSAGNCSAGGYYMDSSNRFQAFVVNESGGTWGQAQEVPHTATLNVGGYAFLHSISCPSAGNCSAGGSFSAPSLGNFFNISHAFVVNESGGTWGQAHEVPNTAAGNAIGDAFVYSISCPSAGNCSAGGSYTDNSQIFQAFVVNESNGVWGQAQEVPNTASLNGSSHLISISCPSAGNCSAGGSYTDSFNRHQAFVVNESNGVWGQALEVPNTATLNVGGNAYLNSISCPSAGSCSAGGYYTDGFQNNQAFVVNESGGTWGQAQTVTVGPGSSTTLNSISCPSAGICGAGGYYEDGSNHAQAFVVNQT